MIEGEKSGEGEKAEKDLIVESWRKVRSLIGSPEYSDARHKYLEEFVERPYQDFLTQFGPVKGNSLKDYLSSWRNFENFRVEHNVVGESHYELGARFGIDALLNDETNIAKTEQDYIRNFLMQINPWGNHSVRAFNFNLQQFIDGYPESSKLPDTISYLYKKAQKQFRITSPVNIWVMAHGGLMEPDDISKIKEYSGSIISASEDYKKFQEGPYSDATYNSSPLFQMASLLREIPGGKEKLEQADKEYPDEFFFEAETEFNCDFHPST